MRPLGPALGTVDWMYEFFSEIAPRNVSNHHMSSATKGDRCAERYSSRGKLWVNQVEEFKAAMLLRTQ